MANIKNTERIITRSIFDNFEVALREYVHHHTDYQVEEDDARMTDFFKELEKDGVAIRDSMREWCRNLAEHFIEEGSNEDLITDVPRAHGNTWYVNNDPLFVDLPISYEVRLMETEDDVTVELTYTVPEGYEDYEERIHWRMEEIMDYDILGYDPDDSYRHYVKEMFYEGLCDDNYPSPEYICDFFGRSAQ